MKSKFLTFLLTICFILPCAFIFSACSEEPTLIGYYVYINGIKTDTFECESGQTAINEDNITVKSNWSVSSKNESIPLSDFDISVNWIDEWNTQQTTTPNFWTNGTASTVNDYATTYEFTLTLKSNSYYTTSFEVVINPNIVDNCRVRIFDGNEWTYSAEMIWGHNNRETDPAKQFRFDIENLDPQYDQQEHMQWALIKKETYDALETAEQKKQFIQSSQAFSTGQIYEHYTNGTYYIFAYVPECNNKLYGEYGDGYIYNHATLTIKPIEFIQTKNENRVLQHSDWGELKKDFKHVDVETVSEISTNVDYDYSSCISTQPYIYEQESWKALELYNQIDEHTIEYKAIQVHAINTADGYKLVDLKNIEESRTEWVFINPDGTQGEDVADNSLIEIIDYKELADYKNALYITVPVYYMVADTASQGIYCDCSNLYKTNVKIRKHAVSLVPHVDIGGGDANTNKFIIGPNTFSFKYGEKIQIDQYTIWGPKEIMENVLNYSGAPFMFEGFDQTEVSNEPYTGYVVLESPHYAWKLDGTNYTSEPLEILYYITAN